MTKRSGSTLPSLFATYRRAIVLVIVGLMCIAILIAAVMPVHHQESVFQDHIRNAGHAYVFTIVALAIYGFAGMWSMPLGYRICVISFRLR